MSPAAITGGCQCGRVRYTLARLPERSHICHCRMCQKAVGGPFAALASVPNADIAWTGAELSWYASSNLAERPFCAHCGTPLGFRYVGGTRTNITLGSLDDPEVAPPLIQYGTESRLEWFKSCEALPGEVTDLGRLPPLESFQGKERP
jgi:hypothetical protein